MIEFDCNKCYRCRTEANPARTLRGEYTCKRCMQPPPPPPARIVRDNEGSLIAAVALCAVLALLAVMIKTAFL